MTPCLSDPRGRPADIDHRRHGDFAKRSWGSENWIELVNFFRQKYLATLQLLNQKYLANFLATGMCPPACVLLEHISNRRSLDQAADLSTSNIDIKHLSHDYQISSFFHCNDATLQEVRCTISGHLVVNPLDGVHPLMQRLSHHGLQFSTPYNVGNAHPPESSSRISLTG